MPVHELLLKVQDSQEYRDIQPGDQAYYISVGKVLGTVILKVAPSGFKGGPGFYLHLRFPKDTAAWAIEESPKMTLQVEKTMKSIPVEGYTLLR